MSSGHHMRLPVCVVILVWSKLIEPVGFVNAVVGFPGNTRHRFTHCLSVNFNAHFNRVLILVQCFTNNIIFLISMQEIRFFASCSASDGNLHWFDPWWRWSQVGEHLKILNIYTSSLLPKEYC